MCDFYALFLCAQSNIVVFGGYDGKEYLSGCESLDVSSSRWQLIAPLNVKRAHAAAAALDDSLFVFGGQNNDHRWMDDAEEYTDVSKKWTTVKARMSTGPQWPGAAVVSSSRIYMVGGAKYWPTDEMFGGVLRRATADSSLAIRRCQLGDTCTHW